jgi:ABC-type bacteriocin/lantibiotic exporter with double-glycine peptidase domain
MLLKLKFYLLELNEIIKLSLNGLKKVYLILFFLSILLLSIFETYVIASLVPIIDNFTSGEKIAQLTIKFNDLIGYEISPRQFMSMIYLFTISSFFLTFFLQISSVYLNRYIVENKNAAWQKRILNSYLSQDVIFFTHKSSGDLMQRLLVHTRNGSEIISYLLNIFKEILISAFIYVFLLILSFKFTLILTVFFILIFFITSVFGKRLIFLKSQKVAELQENIFIETNSIFSGIKIIKIFNKQNFFQDQLQKKINLFKKNNILLNAFLNLPSSFVRLSTFVAVFSAIYFISMNVINENEITILLVFFAASYKINNSIGTINDQFLNIIRLIPSINIIKKSLKIEKKTSIEKTLDFKDSIEFKNLNFSYEENNQYIFKNQNLKIFRNKIHVLIGNSGCGKSTLTDIIAGLSEVKNLEVNIDEKEHLKINGKIIIKNLSYCDQVGFIFPGTLEQNITMFDNNPDLIKLKEAVRVVRIDEIKNLNFETNLFDGGKTISGGQKQRLNLARIIYRNPEVMILDEATSNLDEKNGKIILNNIINWAKNNMKTLIIISHNQHHLKYADYKIEINQKKITYKNVNF